MSGKIQVAEIDFTHTLDLFFSDYEDADHKVETGADGIQRHVITNLDAYVERTTSERQKSSAADLAKVQSYEQHQRQQDER